MVVSVNMCGPISNAHLPRLYIVCGGGIASAGFPPLERLENFGNVERSHFSLDCLRDCRMTKLSAALLIFEGSCSVFFISQSGS